ncbi:MAG: GNAT family N-acetyltransferase [Faecousia sp.]
MKNQITIREAIRSTDVATFWEQLRIYFMRDIFPDPEDEDRAYFLNDAEYRANMQNVHDRKQNRCYYLFFHRDGQDIGFAMPAIFTTEDGKCFIMEYCVYPEFRGNGTGKECARVLLDWAKANGALYAELNYGSNARRRRFWESVGFIKNGADEWGEPLMILPPEDNVPITVEVLDDPEDWQLKKLENGFLKEIGEEALTEEKQERLQKAIRDGKITFFMAKRGYRAVGMCSVARSFSTFVCSDIGMYDDFYIEPVFRKKGIARKLAQAAQSWCKENGMASLTVCCVPCDEGMYQALGFDTRLGATFTHIA